MKKPNQNQSSEIDIEDEEDILEEQLKNTLNINTIQLRLKQQGHQRELDKVI